MKFIFNLLTLIVTSSAVFTYSIPLNKRQNPELNVIEKCNVGIQKYKECIIEEHISNDQLANICNTYQTEKCQNFFKEGLKGLEECNEFNEIELTYRQGKFDAIKIHLDAACTKDDNGQYCSLASYDLSKRFNTVRNEFNNAVNNTCKSKKCIEIAIDYATKEQELKEKLDKIYDQLADQESKLRGYSKRDYESESIEDRQELSHIIEYLKSKECSQIEVDRNSGNSLNATVNTEARNDDYKSVGILRYTSHVFSTLIFIFFAFF